MESNHSPNRQPEQSLLARLQADRRERMIEDHQRQRAAHLQWINDRIDLYPSLESAVAAHALAVSLHSTALATLHQADANRAWEATMTAAVVDGSE